MRLLTQADLANEVTNIVKGRSDVRIAVAFWGSGAIRKLKLKSARRGRILCNLESGCCNPEEVRHLLRLGCLEVRTLSTLHAKLYSTDVVAIVGSSNASTNGLALEGEVGWNELNLLVNDSTVVKQCSKWFEQIWAKSRKVTEDNIEDAAEKWRKRNELTNALRLNPINSLLNSFKQARQFMEQSPIYIALFRQQTKDRTHDEYKAKSGRRISGDYWLYDYFDEIPSNSWFIDVEIKPPRVSGLARTFDLVNNFQLSDGGIVWIAHERDIIEFNGRKISLTHQDRAAIRRAVPKLWKNAKGNEDCRLIRLGKATPFLLDE